MKTAIFLFTLFGSALTDPKILNKPNFRRIYIDSNAHDQTSTTLQIIGGHEAKPHSIPFQVLLTVNGTEDGDEVQWLCGGSLISQNYVLTSGHCGYQATSIEVLLGAHNITDETEESQVKINSKNIILHAEFDIDNNFNDIAVIELETPVELNQYIQVSKLPSHANANKTYDFDLAQVSGWGRTNGFVDSISPVLMEVTSNIMTNEECTETFYNLQTYQICLNGYDGESSCNGDSGGPLTTEGEQIGIVSYRVMFCIQGYPTVYTRTSKFLDWIEANTDVIVN